MKLPDFTRLAREDFKDAKGDWVDKLIDTINSFNEQIYNGLDHQLTLTDNIVSQFKDLTFTTSSTYTASNTFEVLKWTVPFRARSVIMVALQGPTNTPFYNPTTISWYPSDEGVVVSYITGLANSTLYKVRFLVF